MICPSCRGPMTLLLVSAVCDRCNPPRQTGQTNKPVTVQTSGRTFIPNGNDQAVVGETLRFEYYSSFRTLDEAKQFSNERIYEVAWDFDTPGWGEAVGGPGARCWNERTLCAAEVVAIHE